MPSLEREEKVANAVAAVVEQNLGVHLGSRRRRDEPPPGLTVDFTYDDNAPGAALEITSVQWEEYLATWHAAKRLERRLSDVATEERLGSWRILVQGGHPVKAMTTAALAAMRTGRVFSTLDLFHEAHSALMGGRFEDYTSLTQEYDRWCSLGLLRMTRIDDTHHGVTIDTISTVVTVSGFAGPLTVALYDNAQKLGAARPRVTHLVVDVDDLHASADSALTPPPPLPVEVDYLWVVHAIDQAERPHGWWTARDDDVWRAISEGDLRMN